MESISNNKSIQTSNLILKNDRLLTKNEVLKIVGFQKSKLYELIKKLEFPAPFTEGIYKTMPRWSENEVLLWLNSQIKGNQE
jgi:predicted DNA-binding transcriptional regulator AlpA